MAGQRPRWTGGLWGEVGSNLRHWRGGKREGGRLHALGKNLGEELIAGLNREGIRRSSGGRREGGAQAQGPWCAVASGATWGTAALQATVARCRGRGG
jgi:hypothetical protein